MLGVRGGVAAALACLACAGSAQASFPEDPPNDPLFDASPLPNATNEQWDLASPAGGFDRGISADRAWRITLGEGSLIAFIDTGVSFAHPDLRGQFAGGRDFFGRDANAEDDARNGHGTLIAGTLAAATNNATGIAGTAPAARLLAVRGNDHILPAPDRIAQSIVYAADRRADAASMSLGSLGNTRALRRAAAYATRRGTVLCAASGNEFHFHHNYPAVLDEVIAVGGVTYDTTVGVGVLPNLTPLLPIGGQAGGATRFDIKAAYSDYGPHLDLVAPTTIPTTKYPDGYTLDNGGTSSATPHVCGVAALVRSRARKLGLRLSAGEVRQILRGTAHDIVGGPYGNVPGWDRWTGYGRVDALDAVTAVQPGGIPPAVNLTTPGWYAPLAGTARVRASVRGRAYPVRWTLEAGAGEEPSSFRRLASGVLRRPTRGGAAGQALGRLRPGSFPAGGITLRLRATDGRGNRGEDRGFVLGLPRDRQLRRGYPRFLGSSGEASPQLANVDRRRGLEILLATQEGELRILSGRTGRSLPGWPRRIGPTPGSGPTARRIGPVRPGLVSTPAVGDLDRNGTNEIVSAGLDGRLRVYDRRGRMRRGFPVRVDLRRPQPGVPLDPAVYGSPALADLDGDRRLDIVVGAGDQKVYAWNHRGRRLRGWPVLAREAASGKAARILSSPAVGDIDGDQRPDVVIGTGEAYGSAPSASGRVYAYSGDGRLKAGWPAKPPSLLGSALPLVGEGVPMSPVLADVDGDGADEVAVGAFGGELQLYRGDATVMGSPHFDHHGRGPRSDTDAPGSKLLASNAAFGRLASGGPLQFFAGVVDERVASAFALSGKPPQFDHLMGGWQAREGSVVDGFPRRMEGWAFLNGPAVADVDGAPGSEVVVGSSGYRLHAFRSNGSEPAGWPKQTGGWMVASPAVGDVDGDRRMEVVQVTREGWLFLYDLPTRASRPAQWPAFRHDARNTGRYGRPLR